MRIHDLRRSIILLAMSLLTLLRPQGADAKVTTASSPDIHGLRTHLDPPNADVVGTVRDSTTGQPLPTAYVIVRRGDQEVANVEADQFGRWIVHDLPPGRYTLSARLIGYRVSEQSVTIGDTGGNVSVAFRLATAPVGLGPLSVVTRAPIAVDSRSGNQVFEQNNYHGAPTATTSQILQQSIVGAARAPTGEVHIRGQHAEYTYYIDGVPVPAGISGSLNELFSPVVANRIEFQTGGWDAEYGGKNTAVVNVLTRVPVGGFHFNASTYGGSFGTDGQSLDLSSNAGRWGWLVSASRQESDMRQEPVVFDTLANHALNFHNYGQDAFTFGKLQFVPSSQDALTLNANWSRTRFDVPFDSAEGIIRDRQQDGNSFVNLAWRHQFGGADGSLAGRSADLFSGFYFRHGSLDYMPGLNDEPSFIFFPDTTAYNLSESRSFSTWGTKIDYNLQLSHALDFKAGTQAAVTSGHEDFVTSSAGGSTGPASNSALTGHDLGVYAQSAWLPVEWLELRGGVRWDSHIAPFAGNQHQVSPRIKLTLLPDASNTFYVYYGRLFIPTNIEDLRAITTVSEQGDTTSTSPTLPERDHFYEASYIHRFAFGLVAKLSAYAKNSTPGIDDNTVPGTAITTSVNLAQVRIRGIESAIEIRPPGPLSGYVNFAINHAYGRGPVTGGFFPTDIADVPGAWFDLDHDQRVSALALAVYSTRGFYLSATGIYGSGLTNGADITSPIGLGLFNFNSGIHVAPSFILNNAAGYTFGVGRTSVNTQLFVDNVFDNQYLLKGAFFSGASLGRPRSVQLRVNLGI